MCSAAHVHAPPSPLMPQQVPAERFSGYVAGRWTPVSSDAARAPPAPPALPARTPPRRGDACPRWPARPTPCAAGRRQCAVPHVQVQGHPEDHNLRGRRPQWRHPGAPARNPPRLHAARRLPAPAVPRLPPAHTPCARVRLCIVFFFYVRPPPPAAPAQGLTLFVSSGDILGLPAGIKVRPAEPSCVPLVYNACTRAPARRQPGPGVSRHAAAPGWARPSRPHTLPPPTDHAVLPRAAPGRQL